MSLDELKPNKCPYSGQCQCFETKEFPEMEIRTLNSASKLIENQHKAYFGANLKIDVDV
jgi:hypothetical protein